MLPIVPFCKSRFTKLTERLSWSRIFQSNPAMPNRKMSRLMLKVTHSGAEHCYAALVRLLDRVLVANASARLDDCLHAILGCEGHCIVKWEESIRAKNDGL